MIDKFLLQFVTLFGVGKIKKAPGTIASLITTLLFYLYFRFKEMICTIDPRCIIG